MLSHFLFQGTRVAELAHLLHPFAGVPPVLPDGVPPTVGGSHDVGPVQ